MNDEFKNGFDSEQPEDNNGASYNGQDDSEWNASAPRSDSSDSNSASYNEPYDSELNDYILKSDSNADHGNESVNGSSAPNYTNGYGAPNNGYSPNGSYPYNGNYGYNNQPNPPYGNYPPQNNGQPNPYVGTVPPKKKNSGMRVFIVLIVLIVVLAVALMAMIFTRGGDYSGNKGSGHAGTMQENATGDNSEKKDTDNVGDIVSSPSSLGAGEAAEVAQIAKRFNVGILIYSNDSLYTEGSGVIVKEDNDKKYTYIVTCAHVVNHQNTAISVLMEDGTEYPAELVGFDTRTDLAVVRIEKAGLTAAEIASSDDLIVGQYVYAVGNPGGAEFFGSVTNGIISAIDRPVSSSSTGYEMECIQHTAAINPGNSGGALVNGEGKLIGINSMKIASTEYEGMGFAVPSEVVMEVFNSIIENGYVAGRAKLGITYTTPSGYSQTYAMYVQMKGLPSGTIVIASVSEDSDLASKGVKAGDLITKVNGKNMTDSGMLADMIEDMSVGDTLTLTIVSLNTDNWSQTEKNITVELVVDRGNSTVSTEDYNDNDSSQGFPFGGGSSGNGAQDWYDFFKQYYGY